MVQLPSGEILFKEPLSTTVKGDLSKCPTRHTFSWQELNQFPLTEIAEKPET